MSSEILDPKAQNPQFQALIQSRIDQGLVQALELSGVSKLLTHSVQNTMQA